jgi:hypothetical protein
LAGQLIIGGSPSVIVTVNVHIPVLLLASITEHVTVVVPTGKFIPDAGRHVTIPTPGQLSIAVGVVYVTVAVHVPIGAACMMFIGHMMVGFCVSLTVTVNMHIAIFIEASVAVHVTVVVPTLNIEPDVGLHITVAPGQLSIAVGVVYMTVALHAPIAALVVMFIGQVSEGF